jgi:hypothetical protein
MSERGSRKNTENESTINTVQIDGLVVMKLIKHCHEVSPSVINFRSKAGLSKCFMVSGYYVPYLVIFFIRVNFGFTKVPLLS